MSKSNQQTASVLGSLAVIAGFHGSVLLAILWLLQQPYLAWQGDADVGLFSSVLRIAIALALLASVYAPISTSAVPERRLTPDDYPALFAMIQRVAASAGVPAPAAALLGRGSPSLRTIDYDGGSELVLGVPYLLVLTVDQLEAVVAHEFGHLRTRPWPSAFIVHRRNAAVARAMRLREKRTLVRLIAAPFLGYCKALSRVARPLSHADELGADAVAAGIAGSRALANSLSATDATFECFQVYWAQWVFPALMAGFRPPFFDGFTDFLNAPIGRSILEAASRRNQVGAEVSTDSHPSTHARLEAIAALPPNGPREPDSRSALALFEDRQKLEDDALLLGARGPVDLKQLAPLSWDDFGERVLTQAWAATSERCWDSLPTVIPEDLPPTPGFYADFALSCIQGAVMSKSETLVQRGIEDLASLIMLELWRQGWRVHSRPGEPPWLERGDLQWSPLSSLMGLVQQQIPRETWRQECRRAGLNAIGRRGSGSNPCVQAPPPVRTAPERVRGEHDAPHASHDARWFTRIGYAEAGPFTADVILSGLRKGKLQGDFPVREEGTEQWTNLRDHPSFTPSPGENWVTRSGQVNAMEFAEVPGWTRKSVKDGEHGLVMHFRPAPQLAASVTLCIHRGVETRPIVTGHDSFQALAAFFSALTSLGELEGPDKPYRSVVVDLIDRISLGQRPRAPWALRAMYRVSDNSAPSDAFRVEWIVNTAARNHFVKAIVSLAPEELEWKAVHDFLAHVGHVLFPGGAHDDLSVEGLTEAEAEQLTVAKEIWEAVASGAKHELYLDIVLQHLSCLSSAADADQTGMASAAKRLAEFAEFLSVRGDAQDAHGAAVVAVQLFRQLASTSRKYEDYFNLHQALRLFQRLAAHHAPPDLVATFRKELAEVEQLLAITGKEHLH